MARMWTTAAVLAAFWLGASCSTAHSAELTVYTEHYPPYNFIGKDGTVEGVSTARVRKVLDAAGLDYEIVLLPWSRAVLFATSRDNTLIYTITRTPEREVSYDWLVPLAQPHFYLYVRADDYRDITDSDLRAGKYTAACVSGDLSCDILGWAGVPPQNVTTITDSGTGDFRLVLAGRADLYVSSAAANARLRQSEGFRPDVTKPVRAVGGTVGFYLAAGRQVSPEVRKAIRDSYERLLEAGEYNEISAEEVSDPSNP